MLSERIMIRLEEEQMQKLDKLAEALGTDRSHILRNALEWYFEHAKEITSKRLQKATSNE